MTFLALWLKSYLSPRSLMRQPSAYQLAQMERRVSRRYRLKKRIVKDVWLVSSVAMLLNPALDLVIPLILFVTFLSFCILDETP